MFLRQCFLQWVQFKVQVFLVSEIEGKLILGMQILSFFCFIFIFQKRIVFREYNFFGIKMGKEGNYFFFVFFWFLNSGYQVFFLKRFMKVGLMKYIVIIVVRRIFVERVKFIFFVFYVELSIRVLYVFVRIIVRFMMSMFIVFVVIMRVFLGFLCLNLFLVLIRQKLLQLMLIFMSMMKIISGRNYMIF